MEVLHAEGCVYTALSEIKSQLSKHDVESDIFQIGTQPVRGCIACGACAKLGKCAFNDDVCNPLMEKMLEADGIIIGSPVYYAGTNGALCAVLDRAFYASQGRYARKPGCSGSQLQKGRSQRYFRQNQ